MRRRRDGNVCPMATIVAVTLVTATASAAPEKRSPAEQKRQFDLPALPRMDFNRLALLADLPLYWVADANDNALIDPDELATSRGPSAGAAGYVRRGAFTPRFVAAYRALVELKRQESVTRELDAGRPTLLRNELRGLPRPHRALLRELLATAPIIEDLYLRQTGGFRYKAQSARAAPASRTLFWRNHGPWCQSPASRGDVFCNALPGFPPRLSEAYPTDRLQDAAFCKTLEQHPKARELLDPFTVVRRGGEELVAVPITVAYAAPMRAVAARLRAAARAISADPNEKALERYLLAAAHGFEKNDWSEADEAWAAMNATNSKWYLRVAPDEVYFDPCQQKAGFHLALARIDPASLEWQAKLTPLRRTMEQALARLIGQPYKARDVRFKMPDFIHVVLNAGDSRHPLGAIIGQSLPNWGKVAQEGRNRTVVMTNLYTDPDSMRISRKIAKSLLSPASMRDYTDDPVLLNIILHEATHNFGPHSDYLVNGKPAKELFGGALASTLEELKAQNGAVWYLKLLRDKGLIDDKRLREAYTKSITWAFGHIAQGMFTPAGDVRPYSQLAAVQIGSFVEDGALTFRDGRFTIDHGKLPAAVERLMVKVGRIKATGDVKGARELIDRYVSGPAHKLVRADVIARGVLRYPRATFLYSVLQD